MGVLTARQARFVEEYLVDLNGTRAAIRAGYAKRSAHATASRLLSNDKIARAVKERMEQRAKRTEITQDRVLKELARIAFVNPPDMIDMNQATVLSEASEDDTAAIAAVKVRSIPTQEGVGVEREIRLVDKIRALDLLGRHLGMFTDRLNISGEMDVKIVDDIPDEAPEPASD